RRLDNATREEHRFQLTPEAAQEAIANGRPSCPRRDDSEGFEVDQIEAAERVFEQRQSWAPLRERSERSKLLVANENRAIRDHIYVRACEPKQTCCAPPLDDVVRVDEPDELSTSFVDASIARLRKPPVPHADDSESLVFTPGQ